jgi:hypothetical protein
MYVKGCSAPKQSSENSFKICTPFIPSPVSITLPNFEEILLKKAEVKIAWKNYIIYKNYIKNLFYFRHIFWKKNNFDGFLMIFVKKIQFWGVPEALPLVE